MKRDIFVDTSAFIALRVSDDACHKEAVAFLKTIKAERLRLHTTNFILDEVYAYFCRTHTVAVEMAELIRSNPLITMHRVDAEEEERAWKVLKGFSDKEFSYTDATSFVVMESLGIDTVFAFDEHFKQYGKFVLVP